MNRARRWMISLVILLLVAQIADLVWPRVDERAASPAGVLVAVTLAVILAVYPTGRFVPRWAGVIAVLAGVMFAANAIAGPDMGELWSWPLPIAPLLIALVIGGQGYRYMRRSSAGEREAVRWPLLGTLLLLTITLPADLVAVATTGHPIGDLGPVAGALMQLAFLLPTAGMVAGLFSPWGELVDRVLAAWIVVVISGAVLGAVFASVFVLAGLSGVPTPWQAVVASAAAVLVGAAVVPLARRLARRVVFRRRADAAGSVAALTRRVRASLDAAEIPVDVVETVREAIGARGVALKRSGQLAVWAQSGVPGGADDAGRWEVVVDHLGLSVATLTVWPRPAESSLAAEDRRIVGELAAAAAPALHGARLASAFPELTERERQVLAGIARGLPNAAIAARLGISGKTVANYVSIVLTKLRVPDKERAAEVARRRAAEAI